MQQSGAEDVQALQNTMCEVAVELVEGRARQVPHRHGPEEAKKEGT